MYPHFLSLILLLALLGCQQSAESMAGSEAAVEYEESYRDEAEQPAVAKAQTVGNNSEPTPTLLLREADCRLAVDSLEVVMEKLEQLASFYDGYVADVNLQNYPYERRARFSVRVPAKYFTTTLDSLQAWAKELEYQHITTTDVTEEYVDLKSRLDTKKAVRDRYLAILRNQAKTVEEILLAEEKIRVLQEEIEAREGRLRYLENRVSLSTIHVEMHQQVEADQADRPSWGKRLLQDTWDALRGGGDILRFLYLAVLNLWPILLIVALLWWQRKRIFGRWRKGG